MLDKLLIKIFELFWPKDVDYSAEITIWKPRNLHEFLESMNDAKPGDTIWLDISPRD